MSLCQGCGGVVGRDCFNPQECEWISRDMQARAAAEEYTAPLVARIAELEAQLSARPEALRSDDEKWHMVYRAAIRQEMAGKYWTDEIEEIVKAVREKVDASFPSPLARRPEEK